MTVVANGICQEAAECLDELTRLRGEIEGLAANLEELAFLRRPVEDRWSVGECIAHLNATARPYLDKLPGAVAEARRAGLTGEGPVKRGILGGLFLWVLEPPARMKVKAPAEFQPRPNQNKTEIMSEFRLLRDELADLIESSADLDWARVKMGMPTIPQFRLNLGTIYALLLAHERRHLWQAKQVMGVRG